MTVVVPTPSEHHPEGKVHLGTHAGLTPGDHRALPLAQADPSKHTSRDNVDFLLTRVGLGALGLVTSMTV